MTMLVKLDQSHNWRLKYHLQMPHGTMTDPNGLCQFKGVYHVFHQYEPRWPREAGHGWGHWSSPDPSGRRRSSICSCSFLPFRVPAMQYGILPYSIP